MPQETTPTEYYNDGYKTGPDGQVLLPFAPEEEVSETKDESAPAVEENKEEIEEPPKEEDPIENFGAELEKVLSDDPSVEETGDHQEKDSTRDYSIFPADVQPFLRQTGRKAFDYLRDVYTEKIKLAQQLEEASKNIQTVKDTYLPSDAEGFKYHPKFQEFSQKHNEQAQLEQHWQDQLAAVESGAETVVNVFQDSDGTWKRNEVAVSDENRGRIKADIMSQVMSAKAEKTALATQAEQFKNSYIDQMTKHKSMFDTFRSQFLPKTALDTKVVERALNVFPEYLRQDPRNKLIAELVGAMYAMHGQFQKMKQAGKLQGALKEAAAAQNVSPTSGGKESEVFDMEKDLSRLNSLIRPRY